MSQLLKVKNKHKNWGDFQSSRFTPSYFPLAQRCAELAVESGDLVRHCFLLDPLVCGRSGRWESAEIIMVPRTLRNLEKGHVRDGKVML